MFRKSKLECMRDIVQLGLEVGEVSMHQVSLSERRNATTWRVLLPRDVLEDVNADINNHRDESDGAFGATGFLTMTVSDTHRVSVFTYPKGG